MTSQIPTCRGNEKNELSMEPDTFCVAYKQRVLSGDDPQDLIRLYKCLPNSFLLKLNFTCRYS